MTASVFSSQQPAFSGAVDTARINLTGSRSVAEGVAVNTVLGTLSVVNGSGSYTFTKTADADTKFNVSGTSLRTSGTWDYDAVPGITHSVTVQADNGVDTPTTATFTFVVTNVLEITLAALVLDDVSVEEDSSATINITGATSGSTVSVASGSIPTGMTLNNLARTITGTPSTPGVYNFTLRETIGDGINSPRDTAVTVTVTAVNPTITSSATVSVAENATLSHSLTADETVTWSLISGADISSFELSGSTLRFTSNGTKDYDIPTDVGGNNVYNVTVRATDTDGHTSDQPVAVTVTNVLEVTLGGLGLESTLTLEDLELADASLTEDSAATVNITGASSGSTITVNSGALPTGMTLNSGSRTISGTPTTPGTYSFTLRETHPDGANSPHDTALEIEITSSDVSSDSDLVPPLVSFAGDNTDLPIVLTLDRLTIPSTDYFELKVARDEAMTDIVINPAKVLAGTGSSITFTGLSGLDASDGNVDGELFITITHWNAAQTLFGDPSLTLKWGDITAPSINVTGPFTEDENNPMVVAFTVDESSYITVTGTDASLIEIAGSQPGTSFTARLVSDADLDYEDKPSFAFNLVATDLAGNVSTPEPVSYTVLNDPLDDPQTEWADAPPNRSYYAHVSGSPALILTGTDTVNSGQMARSTNPIAADSFSFEVTVTSHSSGDHSIIGLDNGTDDLGGFFTTGSTNTHGISLNMGEAAWTMSYGGTVQTASISTGIQTGDVFSVVGDKTTGVIQFFRTRSGVTIQIGTDQTITPFGVDWFAVAGNYNNSILTADFTGLSSGSSGGSGTEVALNPSDKSTGITLSNSDHTAQMVSGSAPKAVRGVTGQPSGVSGVDKLYFAVQLDALVSSGVGIAIAEAGYSVDSYPGGGGGLSACFYTSGDVLYDGNTPVSGLAAATTGDIIGVCNDGSQVWFLINGVSVQGDPVAGTGGFPTNGTLMYPFLHFQASGQQLTTVVGTPPSGYIQWEA